MNKHNITIKDYNNKSLSFWVKGPSPWTLSAKITKDIKRYLGALPLHQERGRTIVLESDPNGGPDRFVVYNPSNNKF